jgi:thymidylate synthase
MFWIYQKQTSSLQVAREMGINWWDEWDIGDDTIGRRYGSTIGKYSLMDGLIGGLMKDPFGRRHIMNMYQYSDLNETSGLYPCAYETIWSVRKDGDNKILDMTLIQRSNDYLVAGYINKIQYVALQMMISKHCGYQIGKFCHLIQNLHIYDRHFDAANEIINRTPFKENYPYIELISDKNFYDYTLDDFKIHNIEGIEKITSELELAI